MRKDDKSKLNAEDIRWAELVLRMIDGLAAQAEIQAEGCDPEWMAMQYGLEEVRETVKSIVEDFKARTKK